MITVRFQGKPFNITVIQIYAPTSNAEEAKVEAEVERFYEDLQDLLELTPCRGPAPVDPGNSKRGRRRRGSGNNCLIKC